MTRGRVLVLCLMLYMCALVDAVSCSNAHSAYGGRIHAKGEREISMHTQEASSAVNAASTKGTKGLEGDSTPSPFVTVHLEPFAYCDPTGETEPYGFLYDLLIQLNKEMGTGIDY
ncbi:hypothetical protein KIPB_000276 [Kipferlia bialata]|uniref:Uncharacterized protein n=1 Tax=Kipferlia bialata TaxID=797122 RepID=A0A9K3CQ91_9EUKA|nr:hypothetical protein KIPB_000276 [Kipferlia bialata]|eukprot:g276.t1